MMDVAVVSDLHPDAYTAGYPRFQDVEGALEAAVDIALANNVHTLLFLGDLITNDPSIAQYIRCVSMVQRQFERLVAHEVEVIAIPGNHDVFEDGLGTTAVDLLEPAEVYTKPSARELRDGTFVVLLPYPSVKTAYDPEAVLRTMASNLNPRGVSVVATHLMLEGISIGSETTDFPRGRDVFFPIDLARELFPNAVHVAGHYHRRQTWRGVEVVGSLARLTKGEVENTPGVFMLSTKRARPEPLTIR